MLKLSHIRYFYAVCQSNSIREAAENLHVVQSAVSRQIKILEEEIGMPLFERHPRGVRLTEAGEILEEYARNTVLNLSRARSEIDDLRALRRGSVTIYTVEAGIIDLIPQVVNLFRLEYPAVTTKILVRGSQGVVDAILNDDGDIGLTFNAPHHADIEVVSELPQQLYATVSPSHPIVKQKQISFHDLQQFDIALPDESFGIRKLVDRFQVKLETPIKPVMTTDSIQMLIHFARLNLGITFLPYFAIKEEIRAGRVAGIPITDIPASIATVQVLVHKGRRLPIPADEFLEKLVSDLNLIL